MGDSFENADAWTQAHNFSEMVYDTLRESREISGKLISGLILSVGDR